MNTKLFVLFGLLVSCIVGPLATMPLYANYDHHGERGWYYNHDGHHWWNRHHWDRDRHHDGDRHHDRDHHGGHEHHGDHGGHHGGGKHH